MKTLHTSNNLSQSSFSQLGNTEVAGLGLDVPAARRYLNGVESMAREARQSDNPRVLMTALRVMATQLQTVANMGLEVNPWQ